MPVLLTTNFPGVHMSLESDILPHDDPDHPLKVVIRNGPLILAELPVVDLEAGQRRMDRALQAMGLGATEPEG